jgi:hypothetical protein
MHLSVITITKKGVLAFAASLLVLGLVIAGCSNSSPSMSTGNQNNTIPNTNTSTTPFGVTDAVNNQVLATSLTLSSIILTDNTGKVTTNLLAAGPITFEAAHLDAVQEPLFSPAIPEDTYVSVTLNYSNAQVAYVNTATTPASIVLDSTPTLANTSQTITFASPITISNTTTSLLVDYLVAQSVAISGCTASGCTVTVTPDFDVTAIPIPKTPTNGTNGLQTHKGVVTAISASTDSFTITNPTGIALTIYVNANTVFQQVGSNALCMGVACLSGLEVNALVEVDTITQNSTSTLPAGSLLATRVEVDETGVTPKRLLLGPVTSVTPGNGTAATSFDMVLRQMVGSTSATALETVDVTVTGSTNFLLPPRYALFATALPFTPSFTASNLFAGQHVGVVTSSIATSLSGTVATASSVLLEPQTVSGTINSCTTSQIAGGYTVCNITMPADHWLAKLTGQTTVLVYINSLAIPINATAPSVGNTLRFNGYLFNVGGTLRLVTVVQADPPGIPILAGAPLGPTV